MRSSKCLFTISMTALLAICTGASSSQAAVEGNRLTVRNDQVLRELEYDGHVWRTVRFARADGSDALAVKSDEFDVRFLDDSEVTLDDYQAAGEPTTTAGAQRQLTIHYAPRPGITLPAQAPKAVTIVYTLGDEPYLRKTVTLEMKEGDAIDRLEVERFSTDAPEERGGRGEPVFVNKTWFFGAEYPAAYSRHTDGNTPKAGTGPYDKFGNYSFIDLQGRDIDAHPRPGLIRLMHFPGNAKRLNDSTWGIVGKTAVAGVGRKGETMELAFLDYLNTIRRPVRSFLHYNNYMDKDGADLSVGNFVDSTYADFKKHLDPYGVTIQAMVPDDGWQDKKSIYEPNPAKFPHGMDDMAVLGDALRSAGTGMGLWIALNGYNSDIDWGKANGYTEAVLNSRFKRFHRVYSISNPKYNALLTQRLTDLIQRCHLSYIKHDFNDMCDLGEGNGHLATDRHGHEAEVDAELGFLALERKLNPDIYQNITNWIWFSPWWLQNGNNLWMLSSDSGEFLGWPEISLLIRATAYRDVNLYQVWHDPATRPLVPISHLMTHGIIYTKSKYSKGDDTLRDFSDYVMMYYMRGLQLKEWYINPHILNPQQWEALARQTRWSEEHLQTLANSVFVGGDPSKGEVYGYMCWKGEDGILSARNPSPGEAEITVPFDQTVWYRSAPGKAFYAKVVYPYQGELAATFHSGEPIKLRVPGYTVMVLELQPGTGGKEMAPPALPEIQRINDGESSCRVTIPDEAMQRCDLVLIAHEARASGKAATATQVKIDGTLAAATRKSAGKGWDMTSFDLRDRRGKRIMVEAQGEKLEGWLLMDRPVESPKADPDPRLPMPVAQGFVRQSVPLFQPPVR